jgi:hypothetical protein
VRLLRDASLIGPGLDWAAGDARLWFVGDFVDRGPDGIGVVDLVMRLQAEAATAGGQVGALLGNHEVLLLAADRFAEQVAPGTGLTFLEEWLRNGGRPDDLSTLSDAHARWLGALPAMALVAGRLIIHADALFYTSYGDSLESANAAIQAVVNGDDVRAWDRMLGDFSMRFAFDDAHAGDAGACRRLLERFGGRQVVHGHTPISSMVPRLPEDVTEPLVYADGLAVNVDGGMYLGGPGVVYALAAEPSTGAPDPQ